MATWGRGLDSDRLALRAELARSAPERPAGLFARAWLAQRLDGATTDVAALLDACLRQAPGFEPCAASRVDAFPGATSDDVLVRWADAQLMRGGPLAADVLRRVYFRVRDRAVAARWLADHAARHPGHFVFDYIRGVEARRAGDNAAALAHLTDALAAREGYDHEIVGEAADLIARDAAAGSTDRRAARIADVLTAALPGRLPPRDVAGAWLVAGRIVRDAASAPYAAQPFFQRSYELVPSPDAAHELLMYAIFFDQPRAAALLREARDRFPTDAPLLADEGLWRARAEYDPARSEALYRAAMDAARDAAERRELALRAEIELLRPIGRFRDGVELIAAQPGAMRREDTLGALYALAVRRGDLADAERLLARLHDTVNSPREIWFASQREKLASFRDVQPTPPPADYFDARWVAASNDGQLLSTGEAPAAVYEGPTRRPLRVLGRLGPRAFSPDGRYVGGTSFFTERSGARSSAIYVYECATGRLVRAAELDFEAIGFAWSPDSARVAWFDGQGFVTELELATGTRRIVRGSSTQIGGAVAYSRDGRYLFTAAAQDRVVRVWRTADLQLERTLPGVYWVFALAATADGRSLVAIDNAARLSVFDLASWTRRELALSRAANRIAAHPTDPVVVLSGAFRDRATVIDVAALRVLRELPMRMEGGATFAGAQSIVIERDGGLETITFPTFASRGVRRARGTAATELVPIDSTRVAARRAGTLSIADVASGRELRRWHRAPRVFAAIPGGEALVGVAGHTLRRFDLRSGAERVVSARLAVAPQSIAAGTRLVAIGGVPGADPTGQRRTRDVGRVALYELATGREVWTHDVPIVTGERQYAELFRSRLTVALDEASHLVAVATAWQDGYGHEVTRSRAVAIWSPGEAAPRRTIAAGLDIDAVDFESPGIVRVWNRSDYETYDMATGQRRSLGHHAVRLGDGLTVQIGAQRAEILDARGAVVAAADTAGPITAHVAVNDRAVAVVDAFGAVYTLRAATPADAR